MKPADPAVVGAFAGAPVAQSERTALVPAQSAVVPRKPRGQAGHISPQERREIQLAYLTEPNATISSVAKQFGRTREAISGCVRGEDFEKYRAQIWDQLREEATQGLRAHVTPAVQAWGEAIGIAATKGDHKPAKELLEGVGVIEDRSASRSQVNVVIGMPGHPAGPDVVIDVPRNANGNRILEAAPGSVSNAARRADLEAQLARVQFELRALQGST